MDTDSSNPLWRAEPRKEHLGNGVYIEVNAMSFILTTEFNNDVTNRIILRIEVIQNMLAYFKKLADSKDIV
jgi:hypothetical protein